MQKPASGTPCGHTAQSESSRPLASPRVRTPYLRHPRAMFRVTNRSARRPLRLRARHSPSPFTCAQWPAKQLRSGALHRTAYGTGIVVVRRRGIAVVQGLPPLAPSGAHPHRRGSPRLWVTRGGGFGTRRAKSKGARRVPNPCMRLRPFAPPPSPQKRGAGVSALINGLRRSHPVTGAAAAPQHRGTHPARNGQFLRPGRAARTAVSQVRASSSARPSPAAQTNPRR